MEESAWVVLEPKYICKRHWIQIGYTYVSSQIKNATTKIESFQVHHLPTQLMNSLHKTKGH